VQEGGFRSGVVTNGRVSQIAAEVAAAEGTPFGPAGPSRDWIIGFRLRHHALLWHGNVRSLTGLPRHRAPHMECRRDRIQQHRSIDSKDVGSEGRA